MAEEIVPRDIKDFILTQIESIAHLEALLLLRAHSDRLWDAPAAAQRLYIAEHQGREILARLCAEGLISRQDNGYRYAPQADTATLIDRLAEAYARHLIPITNIIHQRPSRIREFADAFKLKKGT